MAAISPITRTGGECLPMIENLSSYLGSQSPENLMTNFAGIRLITDPRFRNPAPDMEIVDTVRDANGKLKKLIMAYYQREVLADVDTTLSDGCTGTGADTPNEFEIDIVSQPVERVVTFTPSEYETICTMPSDQSATMQGAMPNLMRRINRALNSMYHEIHRYTVNFVASNLGSVPTYETAGNSLFVNVVNSDGSIDTNGLVKLRKAFAALDVEDRPFALIDTAGSLNNVVLLRETGLGLRDNGIDSGALANSLGFEPIVSTDVGTAHSRLGGADEFFVVHPGYMFFIEDYFAPEQAIQDSELMFGRYIDPRTGLTWEMKVTRNKCGGAGDPRPNYTMQLYKQFYAVAMPTDMFKSTDKMYQFTGMWGGIAGRCPEDTCATNFSVAVTNFATDPASPGTGVDIDVSFNLDPVASAAGAKIQTVTITDVDGATIGDGVACTYNNTTGKWEATLTGGYGTTGAKNLVGSCTFYNASGSTTGIALGTITVV